MTLEGLSLGFAFIKDEKWVFKSAGIKIKNKVELLSSLLKRANKQNMSGGVYMG